MNTNDKFGVHWYLYHLVPSCEPMACHVTSRLHFPVPWLESRDPCSGREPSILGVTLRPVGVQDVARHGGPATGGGYGFASKIGPQSQLLLTESRIPKIFVFNHQFSDSFSVVGGFERLICSYLGWRSPSTSSHFSLAWGIPFCFQRFWSTFDQRRWRGWRMPCGRVKRVSQRPTSWGRTNSDQFGSSWIIVGCAGWRLVATVGSCWDVGNSWEFMGIHGNSWEFMGIHGNSWEFMHLTSCHTVDACWWPSDGA